MRFKEGVKAFGIRPEMILALSIADTVYQDVMQQEVTITSLVDSKHKSIVHYLGFGGDLRTRYDNGFAQWPKKTKLTLVAEIKGRLTDEYDVILEGNHIHIEFDPR